MIRQVSFLIPGLLKAVSVEKSGITVIHHSNTAVMTVSGLAVYGLVGGRDAYPGGYLTSDHTPDGGPIGSGVQHPDLPPALPAGLTFTGF